MTTTLNLKKFWCSLSLNFDNRTVLNFASVLFKWALSQRTSGFWVSCSHVASSLRDRALTCICCWHGELCSQAIVSWKCSWNHAVISTRQSCLFLLQCHRRAWRSQASNTDFHPCAQRFLQFVRLYHALHLMRCSKSSQFYIKERYSETVMNFCSSLLLKLCLSNTPIILYPIMLTICCQLTKLVVKCSPSCFFLVPLTIPAFCCSHPNFFETCWSHQTQNNNKFIRSDKFSVFYCEFEKNGFAKYTNCCITVLHGFLTLLKLWLYKQHELWEDSFYTHQPSWSNGNKTVYLHLLRYSTCAMCSCT